MAVVGLKVPFRVSIMPAPDHIPPPSAANRFMAASDSQQKTVHRIYFRSSRDLSCIENSSVDLIVTSPPYPMIQMWDEGFISEDADIGTCIEEGKGEQAFEKMHLQLDRVWEECFRVLKTGSFA